MAGVRGPARPGFVRLADEMPLSKAEAIATLVPFACEELILTASTYNAVVTYKELAARLEERSGIQVNVLLHNWIGGLLDAVVVAAERSHEPPLAALCVRQDGTIGAGYGLTPGAELGIPEDRIETAAGEHRLLCYRRYARDLPLGGGEPAVSRVTRSRARPHPRASTAPARTASLCPRCNMELPSTGLCGYC